MSTWGIAFGDTVLEGDFTLGSHDMNFASGAGIIRFPDDGVVIVPPTLKVSKNYSIMKNGVIVLIFNVIYCIINAQKHFFRIKD